MSFQIETAWVNQYNSNIELQYQQMTSRLQNTVRVETQNAEFEYYDRIGPTTAQKKTSRHADTPITSTVHDRRQCGLSDYEWADFIDEQDRIRMIADPASSYVQNAIAAMNRAKDVEIITAFNAIAKSGKAGATSTSFPSSSQVAVGYVDPGASAGNTNMTIAKLRRVKYLLMSTEAVMDGEPVTAVVSASQIESLLRTTEITNNQYNEVKALYEGKISHFMGFDFVQTELLAVASNIRKCYFYPKSGVILGMGSDLQVDVGIRRDKSLAVQCYVKGTFGAVRTWEAKVIEVACDETK
jgi:hypothetical protein